MTIKVASKGGKGDGLIGGLHDFMEVHLYITVHKIHDNLTYRAVKDGCFSRQKSSSAISQHYSKSP